MSSPDNNEDAKSTYLMPAWVGSLLILIGLLSIWEDRKSVV